MEAEKKLSLYGRGPAEHEWQVNPSVRTGSTSVPDSSKSENNRLIRVQRCDWPVLEVIEKGKQACIRVRLSSCCALYSSNRSEPMRQGSKVFLKLIYAFGIGSSLS